ncbi:hypothetical protein Gohar_016675 [Gossypium harknessii]|uniref:Zinc knuckle CX2CX4HX4C domain-containing protein n=1 Tax=Gossypium harknessii TaxID=34285 RepID=A0A7J9G3N0_9ROSI|nr:hypothetical protein [Gossypium harknessii]
MESTKCEGGDEGDLVNCSTKKVPIQGMEEDWDVVMDTTLVAEKVISWKDRLVGMGLQVDERTTTSDGLDGAKEFKLIEEDVARWGMIGKVVIFDFNTNNSVRGRFARIAVFINLDRALITQVLVKRVIQWIEYEYLLIVYLLCDYYRHMKEICPKEAMGPEEFGIGITGNRREQRQISKENKEMVAPNPGTYRPWMLTERWGRRTLRTERKDSGET